MAHADPPSTAAPEDDWEWANAVIPDDLGHYDDLDVDDGSDLDPCNHCPHDNTRHRGDGCLDCGCDVPQ